MELTWVDGEVAFRWPWLVALLTVLVVGILALWIRTWRRRTPPGAGYVAHAARLSALPRYRTMVRTRILFGALASIATVIAVAGTIILSGRLAQTSTFEEQLHARDVILCLDASGSMADYNVDVLREMQRIVEGLRGERVGLAIWSKATITVFPLTDDYDFARLKLDEAESAFDGLAGLFTSNEDLEEYSDFIAGTQRMDGSATVVSQIGDGLASCVQRFSDSESTRGRAVILASDNEPYGEGAFTLMQASDYALEHDVVVHGIGTEGTEDRRTELAEFEEAVSRTGGIFGNLDTDASAEEIVAQIDQLEAAEIEQPPTVQQLDRPSTGIAVTGIGLGMLALVWLGQRLVTRSGRRS